MLQTITPIFTDETALIDLAVRHGLAPAATVLDWNETAAHDAYFLSLAGISTDAHVLDLSPHGMRVGLSLANHVRAGNYVALEWLDPWVGFSRDLIALHGLEQAVEFRHGPPSDIVEMGREWDAIVLWDVPFRGDGTQILQLLVFAIGVLKPGGCIAFQYRSPPFLEQPTPVRRGLFGDGSTPEFAAQETTWMYWEQVAKKLDCRFEVIGKRLTPDTKVAFIRK